MRRNVTGAACLLETERLGLHTIPLEADWSRVRLYRAGCAGPAGWLRRLVLQASRNRAVALGNLVFLPDRCEGDLGVLAHELTHCAQYQAWGPGSTLLEASSPNCRSWPTEH